MPDSPGRLPVFSLTMAALVAFASNSLLCRLAMRSAGYGSAAIDPASFTAIRLTAGALTLAILLLLRGRVMGGSPGWKGNWPSALALFAYAAPFSFAYLRLTAATGALILFGSVQATMIGWGIAKGSRPGIKDWIGLSLAISGLALLVAPGLSAPDPLAALLMALAGLSWGIYSLRGRKLPDPLGATAGNFALSLFFLFPMIVMANSHRAASGIGILYAVVSGSLASGLGYSLWYTALRRLTAIQAAVVQLLVPVLAALAGVLLLHEPFTLRIVLTGTIILAGIALVVLRPKA